ncbi:MAG: hypothetical protein Q8P13_02660 [bacterium]|nr:hypothetical protein [bacterium]
MFPIGEPGENPVTPEEIVGIPSPAPKTEDEEKRKSPDRVVPPEAQKAFEDYIKTELTRKDHPFYFSDEEEKDTANLFFAQRGSNGEVARRYFRYLKDDESDEPIKFFTQSTMHINKGYAAIYKADVAPNSQRGYFQGYMDSDATVLRATPKGLDFVRVFDDQTMILNHNPENQLNYLAFHKVGNIKSLSEIIEQADSTDAQPVAAEAPSFALVFSPDTLNTMVYDEAGNRKITEVKMVEEFAVDGRRVQVANAGETVKLVFYLPDDPNKVDYEITLPRKQETEEYWTGDMNQTKPIRRYTWEKDLIPEPLRTNVHAPQELDDAWKRADLARTIGIKIEKNLAA